MDEILLRHAQQSGASVFEEHKVTEIEFAPGSEAPNLRPVACKFTNASGEPSRITFDYLVDASGRNGIMSTKYLKNRQMNNSLKNLACWGYWTNAQMYMPGTTRENAPWFESLTGTPATASRYIFASSNVKKIDESGWGWFIPLHDGTVSVGIVMDMAVSASKKVAATAASQGKGHSLKEHYLSQLDFVPGLKKLLEGASLKEDGEGPAVKAASDFSYAASNYAGDHYRLVGDASGRSSVIDFYVPSKSADCQHFFPTSIHRSILLKWRSPCSRGWVDGSHIYCCGHPRPL